MQDLLSLTQTNTQAPKNGGARHAHEALCERVVGGLCVLLLALKMPSHGGASILIILGINFPITQDICYACPCWQELFCVIRVPRSGTSFHER